MGLFDRLFIEGARAGARDSGGSTRHGRYEVDVDTFGAARFVVAVGDIDGSGELPGVQMEIEHQFTDGPRAIAFSSREADLAARALLMASAEIQPHEALRARRRKWNRSLDGDTRTDQPSREPDYDWVENVKLSKEEVQAIMRSTDPALAALRQRLEIPF